MHYLFKVADIFFIRARGLVIAENAVKDAQNQNIKLRVGDSVQIKSPDGLDIIEAQIIEIEFVRLVNGNTMIAYLLSPEVSKDQIKISSEVWSS